MAEKWKGCTQRRPGPWAMDGGPPSCGPGPASAGSVGEMRLLRGPLMDRHHTQQQAWRLHRGHLSSDSFSFPGLELLTLIALSAQQRSQSEKTKRTNRRPTSQEKGAGQVALVCQMCLACPCRGQGQTFGESHCCGDRPGWPPTWRLRLVPATQFGAA